MLIPGGLIGRVLGQETWVGESITLLFPMTLLLAFVTPVYFPNGKVLIIVPLASVLLLGDFS